MNVEINLAGSRLLLYIHTASAHSNRPIGSERFSRSIRAFFLSMNWSIYVRTALTSQSHIFIELRQPQRFLPIHYASKSSNTIQGIKESCDQDQQRRGRTQG